LIEFQFHTDAIVVVVVVVVVAIVVLNWINIFNNVSMIVVITHAFSNKILHQQAKKGFVSFSINNQFICLPVSLCLKGLLLCLLFYLAGGFNQSKLVEV